MLPFRKRMQIIFQDPYASLNPRQTIEQALTEPMLVHKIGINQSERRDRIVSLLEEVGLGLSSFFDTRTNFLADKDRESVWPGPLR